MRRYIHTITQDDVGKGRIVKVCPFCQRSIRIFVRDFMGQVQQIDVGKRIFKVGNGVYQVENQEQLEARKQREAKCKGVIDWWSIILTGVIGFLFALYALLKGA